MPAPKMINLTVIVGPPGTNQGSGVPLIRNVPGPVPFTVSADWFGPAAGGEWDLGLTVRHEDGEIVRLMDGAQWARDFTYKRNFSTERFAKEQFTVLALLEKGGTLKFERRVNGDFVGEVEVAIEVEVARG